MDARYAGGGGGCMARYAGGGGYIARFEGGGWGLYNISMVDRIMLKFRPIAPKPVASGLGSGGVKMENSVRSGRGKRSHVVVTGNKENKKICCSCGAGKKRKVSSSSSPPREAVSGGEDAAVTLSLMPEMPDRKEESQICYPSENLNIMPTSKADKRSAPIWLSFKNKKQTVCDDHVRREAEHVDSASDHRRVMIPPQRQQAVSFVTVECMTEMWVDREGIGCADEEMVANMEGDTCPGFISDGGDRVVWTNKAFREMAGRGGQGEEIVVVVLLKEGNRPVVSYPAAFTCNVRITCRSGMTPSILTVPCDVWSMEGGSGHAWRLDVNAALCLGR